MTWRRAVILILCGLAIDAAFLTFATCYGVDESPALPINPQ